MIYVVDCSYSPVYILSMDKQGYNMPPIHGGFSKDMHEGVTYTFTVHTAIVSTVSVFQ